MCALEIISKKPLPYPRLQRFIPMISSNSFIVLGLIFRLWCILSSFCVRCEVGILFYLFIFFNNFIFGCAGVFIAARAFFWLQWLGVTLYCGGQASHCGRFPCGVRTLGARAPGVCGMWAQCVCPLALGHRLYSCGMQAWLLWGMWGLPGSGIKPVSCVGRQILYHWATGETVK